MVVPPESTASSGKGAGGAVARTGTANSKRGDPSGTSSSSSSVLTGAKGAGTGGGDVNGHDRSGAVSPRRRSPRRRLPPHEHVIVLPKRSRSPQKKSLQQRQHDRNVLEMKYRIAEVKCGGDYCINTIYVKKDAK